MSEQTKSNDAIAAMAYAFEQSRAASLYPRGTKTSLDPPPSKLIDMVRDAMPPEFFREDDIA